jgi:hypothetical protein
VRSIAESHQSHLYVVNRISQDSFRRLFFAAGVSRGRSQ